MFSRIKVYCETLPVMKISSLWNAKIVNLLNFLALIILKFPGLQYVFGGEESIPVSISTFKESNKKKAQKSAFQDVHGLD